MPGEFGLGFVLYTNSSTHSSFRSSAAELQFRQKGPKQTLVERFLSLNCSDPKCTFPHLNECQIILFETFISRINNLGSKIETPETFIILSSNG